MLLAIWVELKTVVRPYSKPKNSLYGPGMCRKLGPNCGYPQFRVIFAQKLGWCWVVGVNLPKLGSNNPNFTPISPPNCGKIGVKLVLWLGLGVVFHILIGLGLWLGVSKPHFAHPWPEPFSSKDPWALPNFSNSFFNSSTFLWRTHNDGCGSLFRTVISRLKANSASFFLFSQLPLTASILPEDSRQFNNSLQ